ncbi:MAG TPA: formimidoylglutamate deiminase [Streptosporangiaceae bacterium]|nr:formimidoylglutamate deiminase [Streptosporangiaceae bacterium]
MKGPRRAGHAPHGPAAAGPGRSGHGPPVPTAGPSGAPGPGRPGPGPDDEGGERSIRRWHAELAWLPGVGVRRDVLIEAAGDRFTTVTAGVFPDTAPAGTTMLAGLTLPGLANAHSHAFHRGLRGTVQAGHGTFWTWREQMYRLAAALDPDRYFALARAVYAEMALAGITCVGEFHYVHHSPGGVPYADPNEMTWALLRAAAEAGLRITLLDTCYLAAGLNPDGIPQPLEGVQLRFGDGDAARWAERVGALSPGEHGTLAPGARIGAAIHSLRAVPPDQMPEIVSWSHQLAAPLHAHLSEQPAENEAALAAYGRTPTRVLYEAGALGPRSTMVHATHLTRHDIGLLGATQTTCCLCPTTEADLADGIGPARELATAGAPVSLGSDSHAVIDLLAEARWLELSQRLATGRRVHFTAAELGVAATSAGHACLGWADAGEIVPGALADLVTVDLDAPRLAGGALTADGAADAVLERAVFAATAADVRHVVISGRDVVRDRRHLMVGDVAAELSATIRAVQTAS